MSGIKVRKVHLDWLMSCVEHDAFIWTDRQADAFEAGLGHFMMHHKPLRPVWEISVWDGRHFVETIAIAQLDTSGKE